MLRRIGARRHARRCARSAVHSWGVEQLSRVLGSVRRVAMWNEPGAVAPAVAGRHASGPGTAGSIPLGDVADKDVSVTRKTMTCGRGAGITADRSSSGHSKRTYGFSAWCSPRESQVRRLPVVSNPPKPDLVTLSFHASDSSKLQRGALWREDGRVCRLFSSVQLTWPVSEGVAHDEPARIRRRSSVRAFAFVLRHPPQGRVHRHQGRPARNRTRVQKEWNRAGPVDTVADHGCADSRLGRSRGSVPPRGIRRSRVS